VVFFDLGSQDVFLHVARIGREYLLACEALRTTLKGQNLSTLLDKFEAEMRRYLAVSAGRSSNVITHPAAKLMIAMTAVFLLSRLDNSDQAQAATQQDAVLPAERKTEGSAAGRTKSVITKLYESVDSPTTVAAIAGILISLELVSQAAAQDSADDESGSASWASILAPSASAPITPTDKNADTKMTGEAADVLSAKEDHGPDQLTVDDPSILVSYDAMDPLLNLSGKFIVGELGLARSVVTSRQEMGSQASSAVERSDAQDGVPDDQQASPKSTQQEETKRQEKASESGALNERQDSEQEDAPVVVVVRDVEPDDTLAFDLFEAALIDLVKETVVVDVSSKEGVLSSNGGDQDKGLSSGLYEETAFQIGDLPLIESNAGFSIGTFYNEALSVELLRYFVGEFKDYEVEVSNNIVMLEERMNANISLDDVGVWKNQMSDGSQIAVIGQISHFDSFSDVFAAA